MEKYFGKLIKDYGNLLSKQGIDGGLQTKLIEGFKDILNVDAVNFILDTYKKEVLDREFGNCDLSNKIIGELEKALVEERKK